MSTPGPWQVGETDEIGGETYIEIHTDKIGTLRHQTIAWVLATEDHMPYGRAALIAAAPETAAERDRLKQANADLVKTLDDMLDVLDRIRPYTTAHGSGVLDPFVKRIERARAAIAKARGET